MDIISCQGLLENNIVVDKHLSLLPGKKTEICAWMNYFYTENKVIQIYSYQTLEY